MLRRSGSKRIVVDAEPFRYRVSELGADDQCEVLLAVTVQHDRANGALLRVWGLASRRVPESESKFYAGRTVYRSIEPRHVERLIRIALARGWNPKAPGSPFRASVANTDVFDLSESD